MNRYLTVFWVLTFLVAADKPGSKDTINKEKKKLEGTWTVISLERDGQKLDIENLGKVVLTFKREQLVLDSENNLFEKGELTYELDPSPKPKAIDLIKSDGKAKKVNRAIYSIDGDELKLCIQDPAQKAGRAKRPDSFETKEKPVILLYFPQLSH
jgi:uncharacterized protein (TIGR03067 family)